MKRRIENRYHRCIRHQFLTSGDTQKVWWIVQRRELYALLQSLDDFFCDQYGLRVLFARMYDSVTDSAEKE